MNAINGRQGAFAIPLDFCRAFLHLPGKRGGGKRLQISAGRAKTTTPPRSERNSLLRAMECQPFSPLGHLGASVAVRRHFCDRDLPQTSRTREARARRGEGEGAGVSLSLGFRWRGSVSTQNAQCRMDKVSWVTTILPKCGALFHRHRSWLRKVRAGTTTG